MDGYVPEGDAGEDETDTAPEGRDDIERVTKDIMKLAAAKRARRKKERESGLEQSKKSNGIWDQGIENVEEDEYTRASVDYARKIEKAKEKSVEEIERIARYERMYNLAKSTARYSYGWFCTLLEMEAMNSCENSQNSREISIAFGKVEREQGTSRTLVLRQPSRNIPRFLEDLSDIPLVLYSENQTKKVAIEVASVQSYSLRVKLKDGNELGDYDLNLVKEAHIDARNPVFLIDSLKERFHELDLPQNYCMRNNLCKNIEFVFGPPGTGKTTYLSSRVILPLLKENKVRILVLTPTNKAADVLTNRIMSVCDNILWKDWLVRFGITGDEAIENAGVYKDKTFDLREMEKCVAITTIARFSYDYFMPGTERLYIRDLNWDYIVIDEASMIPIADIVYPLFKKSPAKFIVAGDPFQIEPISTVDLWKDENIYTLVKLDSFTNPVTVPVQYDVKLLTTQYRSVPMIGEVFSRFSYGGILRHNRKQDSQLPLNIDEYLDIQTLNIIKFPVSKFESIYKPKTLQHKTPYHIYSALFTYEYVNYLRNAISAKNPGKKFSIGIIAPYRAQADLIDKLVSSGRQLEYVRVSVGTIHGFQGDECDIVIVVLNTPQTISESKGMFLNKKNILNVAISRARDYLFVIMPDDDTEDITKLKLVKKLESIIKEQDSYSESESHEIERLTLGNERYIENNTFSTSHQVVNVYGLPESKYEIRSEETAVDIQIHTDKA